MDCTAVSVGIGTARQAGTRRAHLRLAFHFGFFQMMMTVLGWLAGSTVARFIDGVDHWIAFVLLAYVGGKMIYEGIHPEIETYETDPSRGKTLILLCVATSIDALAVGLSMAMLKEPILIPGVIIGVVTFGLSLVGLLAGNLLGEKIGKRMEILGGIILIGIGLRVVIEHLFL